LVVLLEDVECLFGLLELAELLCECLFESRESCGSPELMKLVVGLVLGQSVRERGQGGLDVGPSKGLQLDLGERAVFELGQTEGELVDGLVELVGQPDRELELALEIAGSLEEPIVQMAERFDER
jgi:hypothetical protein